MPPSLNSTTPTTPSTTTLLSTSWSATPTRDSASTTYDYIEARALYQDARFEPEPFYQGHKTTDELNPVFKGQQLIALSADQTLELNKEKSSGVYGIDVKLYLRVRFKLGVFKTGKFNPKISCDLHVPLTSTNRTSPAGGFQTTECDWDY